MSFDLIIANPPFGKSSSLSKPIMNFLAKTSCKEIVLLAPFKTYENTFNHITLVNYLGDAGQYFEDVSGVDVTLICFDSSKKGFESYAALQDALLDNKQRKLVEALRLYNAKKDRFSYAKWIRRNPLSETDDSRAFLIQIWPGASKNGMDNKHNLLGETLKSLKADGNVILFNDAVERLNFAKSWYDGKLLLKEIMSIFWKRDLKEGRIESYLELIPRVDWSHPWTDKEILKEIGLPEDFLEEKK